MYSSGEGMPHKDLDESKSKSMLSTRDKQASCCDLSCGKTSPGLETDYKNRKRALKKPTLSVERDSCTAQSAEELSSKGSKNSKG